MSDTTRRGLGTADAGEPYTVSGESDVQHLADWILSPHRHAAIALVAMSPPAPRLRLPGVWVGRVEVYLIDNTDWMQALARRLPDGSGVQVDVVRAYPPVAVWHLEPGRAPVAAVAGIEALRRRLPEVVAKAQRLAQDRGRRQSHEGPGLGLAPDGSVHRVTNVAGGHLLAATLLARERVEPVVVVSVHPEADGPFVDAEQLAADLRSAAAVVVIGADASYGLTDGLGDKTLSVFFGAVRVYPVGSGWTRDMYQAPLHLCLSKARGKRIAGRVVTDALAAAHDAGLLQTRSAPDDRPAMATVEGALGSHHVRLVADDGTVAAMLAAHLRVGVPADRLVRKGQRQAGRIRPTGGLFAEFLPAPLEDDALARARSDLPDGTVTLAQVASVEPGRAAVLLHPDLSAVLADDDQDLALLTARGETVGVEIVWEDGKPLAALIADPDSVALAPGLSVLPGGPPWLLPGDLAPAADLPPAEAAEVERPVRNAAAADGASLEQMSQRLRLALDANEILTLDLSDAEARLREAESTIRELRRELRKSSATKGRRRDPPVWRDPERQLRHEIDLAYLRHVPEGERADHHLPDDYAIGQDFIGSLDSLQGISRDKVLDVVVEALTGLDRDRPVRRRRPWLVRRLGAQEVRPDGSQAWRVNLQSHSHAARRLKYWTRPDGSIELDSVGYHDDGLRG